MSENNISINKSVRVLKYLLITILPWIIIFFVAKYVEENNEASEYIKIVNYEKKDYKQPANHGEFEELQVVFNSPQEVTLACIGCHNERHKDVMNTAHWSWDRKWVRKNGDTIVGGKRNMINNYCVATNTNTWKCTSCHAGYGYKDEQYDFTDYKNVDCMVCHDLTGAYEKQPLGSGYPVDKKEAFVDKTYFAPNYNYIAANVGSPDIKNCGVCHFYGGGGDNVKHGDLSSDLVHADKAMDVHMDEVGNNMTCVDCHQTENHQMKGKFYPGIDIEKDRLSCTYCHQDNVHQNNTLNLHANRIACQTCHIPEYAKGVATNMDWDWSTAGRVDQEGKQIVEKDSLGNTTYKSAKGHYTWGTNVKPDYVWYNGESDFTIFGDTIEDPSEVLQVNTLYGDHKDPKAKIIPVKIHTGKQIFDPVTKMLIVPHVYGKDSTSFGVGLDWELSLAKGMEVANLPFSGQYSFVNTEMYWPVNHMVSPSSDALKCIDCHARDGRLAALDGFYMPGRDYSETLDLLGKLLIVLAIGGVIVHGAIRKFF